MIETGRRLVLGTDAPERRRRLIALLLVFLGVAIGIVIGLRLQGRPADLVVPPPSGSEIVVDSFVDNLEARIEAGEWTLEEGLIATLKVFADEFDPSVILGANQLRTGEGTGILRRAKAYVSNGGNADAKAEIVRLLDKVTYDSTELESLAVSPNGRVASIDAAIGAPASSPKPRPMASQLPEECRGRPAPCMEYRQIELPSGRYRVFFPRQWAGDESKQVYYALAIKAIQEVVPVFAAYGVMHGGDVVFVPRDAPKRSALAEAGAADPEGQCTIQIYLVALRQYGTNEPGGFKQTIAHELFHCLQDWNFPAQMAPTHNDWWVEGTAEFFGNVAYPSVNDEHRFLDRWESNQVNSILIRSYENFLVFQEFANETSVENILSMIGQMATTSGADDERAALAAITGSADLFHEFARHYVTADIHDSDGSLEPFSAFGPPQTIITGVDDVTLRPRAFGFSQADLAFKIGARYTLSWVREDQDDRLSFLNEDHWGPMPTTIDACEAEQQFTALATGVRESTFLIKINADMQACEIVVGSTSACPHLTTFDGASFDFYSVGEFVLMEAPASGEKIQVRQQLDHHSDKVVNNTAVAMDVAGTRVNVSAASSTPLSIDGQARALTARVDLAGGGTVEPIEDGVQVRWPSGLVATVHVTALSEKYDPYLGVELTLPQELRGNVRGILGNANGDATDDLMTRAGKVMPVPVSLDDLVDVYGASWRISQAESLFDYPPGLTTDDFTDPTYRLDPKAQQYPEAAEAKAEEVCRAAGVDDPAALEICIYHVALTGNPSYAESAAQMTLRPAVPVPIGGWRILDADQDASIVLVELSTRGEPILAWAAVDGLRITICRDTGCLVSATTPVPESAGARDVILQVSDDNRPAVAWQASERVYFANCLTQSCDQMQLARFDGGQLLGLIASQDGDWTLAFNGYGGPTLGWCGDPGCSGVVTKPLGGTTAARFGLALEATTAGFPLLVFEGSEPGLQLVECLDRACDSMSAPRSIEAGDRFDVLDVAVTDAGTSVLFVRDERVRIARCTAEGCQTTDVDLPVEDAPYDPRLIAHAGDRIVVVDARDGLIICGDTACGTSRSITVEGTDSGTSVAADRRGRVVLADGGSRCGDNSAAPCGLSLLDLGTIPVSGG